MMFFLIKEDNGFAIVPRSELTHIENHVGYGNLPKHIFSEDFPTGDMFIEFKDGSWFSVKSYSSVTPMFTALNKSISLIEVNDGEREYRYDCSAPDTLPYDNYYGYDTICGLSSPWHCDEIGGEVNYNGVPDCIDLSGKINKIIVETDEYIQTTEFKEKK